MSRQSAVVNASGDFEESIERLAIHLGRSVVRRRIFACVYGKGTRPKTIEQLVNELGDVPKQSIRNEAGKLASHHLVTREEIKAGAGRAVAAYGKDGFVKANKKLIEKWADNPKIRSLTSTKRRNQNIVTSIRVVERNSRLVGRRNLREIKVLYLTAANTQKDMLRTDVEVAQVQQELRGAKWGNALQFVYRPAATPKALLDALNDINPEVVHFSGHGGWSALVFNKEKTLQPVGITVDFDLLAELFSSISSPPTILVLNACDTLIGADGLLDKIPAVISMSDSITDLGAVSFASQFYSALGSGETLQNALNQAVVHMKLSSLVADAVLPTMIARSDFDPATFRLVKHKR